MNVKTLNVKIDEFVSYTMSFLNNIQVFHWQTQSYAEHEALGEYYESLTDLNDKLVETYQGNTNKRIHISAGQHTLQNFQSIEHTISEIVQYGQDISKTSYDIAQKNELHQFIDIDSILEEMAEVTSQVQYHLSLK